MQKLKIKKVLFIISLMLSFSFNLVNAFGTEPNLNQPSTAEINQRTQDQGNNQANPIENKRNTYKKSTSVKSNTYSQQQGTTSNFNNSSQNLQQNPNGVQSGANTEQIQQNEEQRDVPKKDKKEKLKSAGDFLTTYPEKFKWIESEENAENSEDINNKPKDLPEVKDEEIVLPEVLAITETQNESSVSFFAGIMAWACIITGVGIILFVLFMNKNGGDFPVDSEKTKKKRKISIAKKYYK